MRVPHFAFFLLIQLQMSYAEPVADCKDYPSMYVVDSVERCFFYKCNRAVFLQYTYACGGNLETRLTEPTASQPCRVTPSACPLGGNAPATVSYSGYTFGDSNEATTAAETATPAATTATTSAATTASTALVAKLAGEYYQAVAYNEQYVLDARESSDPTCPGCTLTYEWSCTAGFNTDENPDSSYPINSCPSGLRWISYQTSERLWLTPSSNDVGNVTIRLKASRSGKYAYTHKTLNIIAKGTPSVTIGCISNCCDRAVTTEKTVLRATCSNCDSFTGITYSWSLKYRSSLSSGSYTYLTLSGDSAQELIINADELQADMKCQATVTFSCSPCNSQVVSYEFYTTATSFKTNCTVDLPSASPCFPELILSKLTTADNSVTLKIYNISLACNSSVSAVSFYALEPGTWYLNFLYIVTEQNANGKTEMRIRSKTEIIAKGPGVQLYNLSTPVTAYSTDMVGVSYPSGSSDVIVPYAASDSAVLGSTGYSESNLVAYGSKKSYDHTVGTVLEFTFKTDKKRIPALRLYVTDDVPTTTTIATTESPTSTTSTTTAIATTAIMTTAVTPECANISVPAEYSKEASPYSQSLAVGLNTLVIKTVVDNQCGKNLTLKWQKREKSDKGVWGSYSTITSATGSDLSYVVSSAGTYQFQAQIDGLPTVYADMYVKAEASKLEARLSSGSARTCMAGSPFPLDGATSYDPDDRGATRGALSFSWSCRNGAFAEDAPTAHFSAKLCHSSLSWLWSNTENQITAGSDLPAEIYTFRLGVSKSGRNGFVDQVVTVVRGFVPVTSVSCMMNCGSKVVSSSRLSLLLVCDSCDTLTGVTYNWTLERRTSKSPLTYQTVPTSEMSPTGSSSAGFSLRANSLEEGGSFLVTVTVACETCVSSPTSFSFQTNRSPYGGSCSIDPQQGEALLTRFTVTCSGWTSADRLPLMYRIQKKFKDRLGLLYYGPSAVSSAFPLSVGSESDGFSSELVVTVQDTLGSSANSTITVTVGMPNVTAGGSMQEMTNSIDNLDLADTQGATQAIQAMASLLNLQTDSSSTGDAGTASSRAQVRQKMVTQIKDMSSNVDNLDDVMMVTGALGMSTEAESEINTETMDDATDALTTLSGTASRLLATQPEQAVPVTSSILPATWNIQYATTPKTEIVQEEPMPLDPEEIAKREEAEEARPLTPEERAYRDRKQQIIIDRERANSERVAQSLAAAGDTMVDLVLGTLTPGEDPVVIESAKASSSIRKTSLGDLANSTTVSAYGSVRMPDFETSGNTSERVQTKAATFKSNPFLWGANSASITSPVTSLNMTDSSGKAYQPPKPVTVSIKTTQTISPTEVNLNASLNQQTGMVYHKVNITTTGSAVVLELQPPESAAYVEVYVNPLIQPTLSRYVYRTEWNMTSLRAAGTSTLPLSIPTSYLPNVGIYYIGVRPLISDTGSRRKRSLSSENTTDTYSIAIRTTSCQTWDSDLNRWVTGGETVAEESSLSSTTCRVTPTPTRTVFGLSFISPPNTIDFSTVWAKFADLKNNAGVFSIVCIFILLYLIGLVFAAREDRRDETRWAVALLADNLETDEEEYLVTVETGLKRGAGTTANVWCTFYGSEISSGVRNLEGHTRIGFPMGSSRTFLMRTPRALGRVRAIKLWQDGGPRTSWYVETVTVLHVRSNTMWSFLCRTWLAQGRGDGRAERRFTAATATERARFSFLYSRSARSAVTDSHIWLSVLLRPIRSRFTRAQRISCCLATLFLSMVVSAMFYGTEDNVERPGVLRLGPFIFSFQELWVSLVSVLITVPPLFIVMQIFRKAKRRQEGPYQSSVGHYDNSAQSDSVVKLKTSFSDLINKPTPTRGEPLTLQRPVVTPVDPVTGIDPEHRERTLPWWMLIFGWTLCAASILVPAFFVILYSMDWGPDKSNAWLTAYFLSFFESIFLCDPAKVILVALVTAVILYRAKMKDEEVIVDEAEEYEDNYDYFRKMYGAGGAAAAEAEREARLSREREAKSRVQELAVHVVFLLCVILVSIGAVDPNGFHVHRAAHDTYIPTFNAKVTSRSTFFNYVQTYFIPTYFASTDVNGKKLPWRLRGYTTDVTAFRVGPARFRHLRVNGGHCQPLPFYADGIVGSRSCYPDYRPADEAHGSYTPEAILNDTLEQYHETRLAWNYQSASVLRGEPVWTEYTTYQGGGYVAKFDINRNISEAMIQELRQYLWLDRHSRAVMIEFTTFNPNVNLFTYVTLVSEFLPTGGAVRFSTIQVLQGYALGFFTTIVYISGVITILFTIGYGVVEVKRLWRSRSQYFHSVISWVNIAIIVIVIASIVLFALRMSETSHVLSKMKLDLNAYVPFQRVAMYDEAYRVAIAFLNCFVFWKLVILMKVNKRFANFITVLTDSLPPLVSFAVCFAFILLSFSFLGYLLYMPLPLNDYRTIPASITTMLLAFIGMFDVAALVKMDPLGLAQVYFSAYMMAMNFLMINIMIAILCDSQAALEVNEDDLSDLAVIIAKLWPDAEKGKVKDVMVREDTSDSDKSKDTEIVSLEHSAI